MCKEGKKSGGLIWSRILSKTQVIWSHLVWLESLEPSPCCTASTFVQWDVCAACRHLPLVNKSNLISYTDVLCCCADPGYVQTWDCSESKDIAACWRRMLRYWWPVFCLRFFIELPALTGRPSRARCHKHEVIISALFMAKNRTMWVDSGFSC